MRSKHACCTSEFLSKVNSVDIRENKNRPEAIGKFMAKGTQSAGNFTGSLLSHYKLGQVTHISHKAQFRSLLVRHRLLVTIGP